MDGFGRRFMRLEIERYSSCPDPMFESFVDDNEDYCSMVHDDVYYYHGSVQVNHMNDIFARLKRCGYKHATFRPTLSPDYYYMTVEICD